MQLGGVFAASANSLKGPAQNVEFEEVCEKNINKLKSALERDDCVEVAKIKRALSNSGFSQLCINVKMDPAIVCSKLVLVAAQYNDAHEIRSLVQHLDIETKLSKFNYRDQRFDLGITSLHYTALGNMSADRPNYSFAAASEIKRLVYFDGDHRYWLELLSAQTPCKLQTPVHFAARLKHAELLELFSSGLTSGEWKTVLSIRNQENSTPMHTHFRWECSRSKEQQKACIAALRGPLTDVEWVDFLIEQDVLKELSNDANFQQIVDGISDSESIKRLVEKRG